MLKGIGVDIVRVDRFDSWLQRDALLKRFFHAREIEYCRSQKHAAQSFAVRFAAREALAKALGTGFNGNFVSQDAWIERSESGSPYFCFSERAQKILAEYGIASTEDIHISLSHEREYAVAFVVVE